MTRYLCAADSLIMNRAVHTGIFSFSHIPVFRWKLLCNYKNTAENPNRKTHLWRVVFWNSAGFSLFFFCQCKRSLPSRRYYLGFWSRGTWPSAESPTAHDVLRTTYGQRYREVEHAHLLPKNQYEILVFSRMRFSSQKTRKAMGISGSVNGTVQLKTQVLGFWFLPIDVNGPTASL